MKWVKGGRYQIIYLDQNNQISARNIKVVQEREYALLAYCFDKKSIRTFLKDGILGFTKMNSNLDWLPTKENQSS